MKTTGFYISLILLLTFFARSTQAQATYQVADDSKMVIKGTSSLHDWESDVTQLQGEAQVKLQSHQPQFEQLTLSIPVTSIKSGKSAMDKNTYKALQEEEYPTIQFTLRDIQDIGQGEIKANGDLRVAGKTQPVTLMAKYEVKEPNQISLKGSHPLQMTDFGVEPPTAVFGTIKTGDEITIDYTLQLNKSN